jgi:RNA polymerase sigma-70 factor (ECF subfamily)
MLNPEHKADFDLAHKYLSGDMQENKDAGYELFNKIYTQVQAYISSRTVESNEDDREIILSDTMHRCIEKLGNFNGNSTFFTFVCGIADYIILEYRRKKQKNSKVVSLDEMRENGFEEESEELSFYMLPEPHLLKKEAQENVRVMLDSLSPEYRDILEFRLIRGLPYNTISLLSGESVAALESRFRRATKEFIKVMKNI